MEQEKICRLCLQKCGRDFKVVKENLTKVLGFLLENDLFINGESVICENCMEHINVCSNFKQTCLNVDEFIVQCINSKHSKAKLNLKEIYDIPKDHDVCRLCIDSLRIGSFVSLDGKVGDVTMEMMKKCLPELDLSATEKPVICVPCRESLQYYFRFLTNCVIVEENIKKYCESAGVDNTSTIKLKDVLEFTTRNIFDNVDRIKMEDNFYRADEEKCDDEPSTSENKSTKNEIEIKIEEPFLQEVDSKIELEFGSWREIEDPRGKLKLKCEEGDMKDSYSQKRANELEVEQENLNRFEFDIVSSQPTITTGLHGKQDCLKPNICVDLSSKSPIQMTLTNKKVTTTLMHECDFCSYRTKSKCHLKDHLLVHKNPLEVRMYKCASCSFQTKRKRSLANHLLKHKDPLEVTMYKCDFCSFQTKHKRNLTSHLLKHMDPSEVKMYKCNSCLYQTKRKGDLTKHLVKHDDPSEVTMYKCDSCSFQTKRKQSLRNHLLKHRDPSEVTMYKCDSCSYQTKYRKNFTSHLLIHKDPSEVTIYKCDSCLYQTNKKWNLSKHLVKHVDPSEVTMHKCDSCSFQTKRRENLKNHLLMHRDPSKVKMYKCNFCSFQTKHRRNVTSHLLKHMDPSEVKMYKCNFCLYQTKRKGDLSKHLVKHEYPLDVAMYKCDSCSFQTKHRKSLARHFLEHKKDPSEV